MFSFDNHYIQQMMIITKVNTIFKVMRTPTLRITTLNHCESLHSNIGIDFIQVSRITTLYHWESLTSTIVNQYIKPLRITTFNHWESLQQKHWYWLHSSFKNHYIKPLKITTFNHWKSVHSGVEKNHCIWLIDIICVQWYGRTSWNETSAL